jgi:hypothetical protein
MPRFLRIALGPLFRLLIRVVPAGDPWERIDVMPPLLQYGSGARLAFETYLSGESTVSVTSLEDIQSWLRGCEYQSDEILFNEPDFWQHPSTFERLRAGDCEDFAIWAWRKLVELNFDANLVVGFSALNGALGGRHAWVMFKKDGIDYVFEPVRRSADRAVRPLSEVRELYVPEFGVDRHAKRYAYSGYVAAQKKLLAAR